jgi:hypothetical protein
MFYYLEKYNGAISYTSKTNSHVIIKTQILKLLLYVRFICEVTPPSPAMNGSIIKQQHNFR